MAFPVEEGLKHDMYIEQIEYKYTFLWPFQ